LHQENKLISHVMPVKEGTSDAPRTRSGISITLSKEALKDVDLVGYQKPKPRQFLQPPPGQKRNVSKRRQSSEPEEDLRKRRTSGGKKSRAKTTRPRNETLDEEDHHDRKSESKLKV
jgi:hypothetical protein